MQSLIEPLIVSWGNTSRGDSRFVQENEYQGTRDIAAYLSVPAAIQFRRDHHWSNVQDECHRLAAQARKTLADITGLSPFVRRVPAGSGKWCPTRFPSVILTR